MSPHGAREIDRWLRTVLVAAVLIATATVGTALALGEPLKEALRATSLLQARFLRTPVQMDSWGPMWSSLARWREDQTRSPYAAALELDRCKFQYPPASWLLLGALPAPEPGRLACTTDGLPGSDIHGAAWPARPWISLSSALACIGLIGLSIGMAARTWRSRGPLPTGAPWPWARLAAAACAGLAFYPLFKGHALGQVQVFLNLALGLALWWLPRAPAASGALVGLCCLLKPQYALFLAWAALRQQWRWAAGFAAVAVAGHGAALALDGIGVHLQYLQVLQSLSQVGEVFWANQSLNGLLNRWWQPAEAAHWVPGAFPAYHPAVRWGTLAGSLLLLGVALSRVGPAAADRPDPVRQQLDFAVMLAALTLASPIAWEHHHGVFLPVFALLLGLFAARPRWPARSAAVLAVAFVLMANAALRPEWFFDEPGQPWRGLLGSHLWFGALAVFALLLVWRERLRREAGA